MGTLQADFFGYPHDVAGLFPQMVIEVERIEMLARFTQRQVQRQGKMLHPPVNIQSDFLALRFGLLCLRLGRALLDCLGDGAEQLLQRDGLFQEVYRTDARRLDRRFNGAMARHHHDGHGQQILFDPFLEQGYAVGVRHPDVEQHHIRLEFVAVSTGLGGIFRQMHLITLVKQDFRQQFADADFIIHYQYLLACHYTSSASGRFILPCPPTLTFFSMAMRPPCSSTIFFTIASTSPVPLVLVVMYGSKARDSTLSGKPAPLSSTCS